MPGVSCNSPNVTHHQHDLSPSALRGILLTHCSPPGQLFVVDPRCSCRRFARHRTAGAVRRTDDRRSDKHTERGRKGKKEGRNERREKEERVDEEEKQWRKEWKRRRRRRGGDEKAVGTRGEGRGGGKNDREEHGGQGEDKRRR